MSGHSRGKAPAKGPFAGLYQDSLRAAAEGGFVVLGTACAVIEDSDAHAGIEQCLVQHPQDQLLLLDRFDGRNLLGLDDLIAAEAEWCINSKPGEAADLNSLDAGVTLAELNSERYGDLDLSREHLLQEPYGFAGAWVGGQDGLVAAAVYACKCAVHYCCTSCS